LLVFAAAFEVRTSFRAPTAAFWWYVAYLFVYVSSGLVTDHLSEWLKDATLLLQLLLLFWITVNLMRHVATARTALLMLAISCCVLSVMQRFGIATTVAETGEIAARITVLGQNPNTLAHNLSLGLLALVGLAYASDAQPKWRWLYLPPCALIGSAMMPTAARGALLAAMAGITMIVLARGGMQVKARNFVVAILLLGGLSLAAYRTDSMRNRLRVAAESDDFAQREQLFPAAWQMFLEKPLLGWGPANNRYELVKYVPRAELPYRETHNVVLELLTENGLVGATPYLMAMLLSVLAAWRARRGPHGVLPLAMVLTVLVSRMATAGVYTKMHWFVLAFALAADRPQLREAADRPAPVPVRERPARVPVRAVS
jgi:O-antigen ligase